MWKRLLATLGTVLVATSLVAPPTARAAEPNKSTVQKVGDVGEYALPGIAVAVTLAHHDRRGLGQFALAGVTTLAIVNGLKQTVDSRRPNGGGRSFPSGHTASAFLGAGFLHRRYGWEYGVPAYAAAVFVGYSRVHTKQHWTRDVVAGGALGLASNLVFTHPFRGATVTATPNGMALQIRW